MSVFTFILKHFFLFNNVFLIEPLRTSLIFFAFFDTTRACIHLDTDYLLLSSTYKQTKLQMHRIVLHF